MYDNIKVEKFRISTLEIMAKKIKVVKPQSKGMVTIPVEFREKLGIDENSLLQVKLIKNGVVFLKVEYDAGVKLPPIELYSSAQIKQWSKEDKLDEATLLKLKKLLKK